ncbi:MAG TPA: DUF262 domain-containing protein [Verrucomicrobiae bacterium]|nr:DUF262 domain-containing protein [Verrucomicrobiae bacterium]
MAFQTPITVKEAVDSIHGKEYLLPAIQREVVWDVGQITKLFDSLMRDYPIGSFLFWHVDKKNSGKYQFYEFMRNFHEIKNRHNPKANVSGQDDITAILDGQQRLTSLYIGLRGSYAYKQPWKRWDNPQAFPVRRLYLNLLERAQEGDNDLLYKFVFLTDEEATERDKNTFWFKVGDILNIESQADVNDYLLENEVMENRPKEQARFANQTLFKLWEVVHKAPVINYFLERDESLDKVLNIFIRVNSGGTILSYSDLLLSIAAAQWKKRDAREEVTGFVDELNAVGDGFNFDKDLVLKSCLVLGDFKDIAFKVDNFNKENMLKIEGQWDEIKTALQYAVTLVSAFGYSRATLTANSAIIPIAYYLLRKGLPRNYDQAQRHDTDRNTVHQWLIFSLVKRVFGGVPDTVLRPVREIVRDNSESFPLELIKDKFKGTTKSLQFSEDDIENILQSNYGQGYTFSTLALLYPTLDFRNKFHIDHIHARSYFTRARLKKEGVADEDLEFYMDAADRLPNLQLLEGVVNQEKLAAKFKDWLQQTCPSRQARAEFWSKHFIPDVDLSLANFPEFYSERREALKKRLAEILDVQLTEDSENEAQDGDWEVGDEVMARWPEDGKYYPGKIAAIDDDRYRIHFDDGDKATVSEKHVRER